jgi:hypothetical protein
LPPQKVRRYVQFVQENLINVSSIAHNGGVRGEHVVVITAPT